jgi:Ca2+-binding RTX toxin-like protein
MTQIVSTDSTTTIDVSSNDPIVVVTAVIVATVGIQYLEALGPDDPVDLTISSNAVVMGAGSGTTFGIKAFGETTITNLGTIAGDVGIAFNIGNHTIGFGQNEKVINSGTIRAYGEGRAAIEESVSDAPYAQIIVNSGLIIGDLALSLGNGDNEVENSGMLKALTGAAIVTASDDDKIGNTGSILGAIELGDGDNSLRNSGTVIGSVILGSGNDTVANDGILTGDVTLGANAGNDTLVNSGTIEGNLDFGFSTDVLTNSGRIEGLVMASGGGTFTIRNSGSIATVQIASNGTIRNTGTIGFIGDNGGDNVVLNSGLIGAASENEGGLGLGDGEDRVVNLGRIAGEVSLGADNDRFDTRSGVLVGPVDAGAGDDTVFGSSAGDSILGGDGVDSLFGSGGDDFLSGGGGEFGAGDTLVGGAGGDTLDGGLGPDAASYETSTKGIVISLASPSLNTGDAAGDVYVGIEGITGSAHNDTITGNSAFNTLIGGKGSDTITGGGAIGDFIFGGDGNDLLDIGGPAGGMLGGFGNDTYIVNGGTEFLSESASQGTDTIKSTVDYTLATGNSVEAIIANAGTKGLSLTGNELAQTITGGVGADTLGGGAGNDTLAGGRGNDSLTGGANADRFVFNTKLSATANIDQIADFSTIDDIIAVDNAIFTKLVGTGALSADQFHKNTTGLAHDTSDRIIYEVDTGKLFYDSNGSGAGGAAQFALLSPNLALSAADFLIV